MAGEFEQLLPFTWRGLHLPISRVSVSLAHDLVEHKYLRVNGGRVEATGAAPVRISAVIPIANSIFPGKNEKWAAGGLYPDALRNFIIEFGKTATGYVQHPELGEIACKPEKMEFELSGEHQDCTEIHASWVETLDDKFFHKVVPSPVRDIQLGASDLAASGVDLKKLVPQLPTFSDDIESLGRKLTALVDTVSVLSYRSAGLVNRIIYQAHRLEVAIERAATDPTLSYVTSLKPFGIGLKRARPQRPPERQQQQALAWAAIESLQQIKAGAYALRERIFLETGKGVGLYTVPGDTTLAGLLGDLPSGTTMTDLIKMNPNLVRGPVVMKGAVVRYLLPQ